MEANKDRYMAAKADFEHFVSLLMEGLRGMGVALELQEPKHCIFRINRDVRFSKNKDPYKTNLGASMSTGGKKSGRAGYYFHLGIEDSFAGGGLYMPAAENLKKIRQEIDYNYEEFEGIITQKTFVGTFGTLVSNTLKNPPKGYAADNPAIHYLKYKSFAATHSLEAKELYSKNLVANTLQIFKDLQPLVDFINRGLD